MANCRADALPTLIYLGGDSYPEGVSCEVRIARVVAENLGFKFVSQKEFILDEEIEAGTWRSISLRVTRAREFISKLMGPVVLLGRSSGGRVATLLADIPQVKAIICLAYPFKIPNKPSEEARYKHLTTLMKPTLICQGVRDNYGGLRITRQYSFSQAVELFFLDLCHGFRPTDSQLRLINLRVQRFLDFLVK